MTPDKDRKEERKAAMTDDLYVALKDHWDANYTGANAGKVAVVMGRMVLALPFVGPLQIILACD
jgi:hypothetical protein